MSNADYLISIEDMTDEDWSCSASTWQDAALMVNALQQSGPFLALVSFVDNNLDWVVGQPELWLVCNGDAIAVRGYEASSGSYDFYGRASQAEGSEGAQLVIVEGDPTLAEEPAAVEVPYGLLLEPSEAVQVLEQVMTGAVTVPSTRLS